MLSHTETQSLVSLASRPSLARSYHNISVIYYLLSIIYYLLSIIYYLLSIICAAPAALLLLSIIYYLLSIIYYLRSAAFAALRYTVPRGTKRGIRCDCCRGRPCRLRGGAGVGSHGTLYAAHNPIACPCRVHALQSVDRRSRQVAPRIRAGCPGRGNGQEYRRHRHPVPGTEYIQRTGGARQPHAVRQACLHTAYASRSRGATEPDADGGRVRRHRHGLRPQGRARGKNGE